MTEKKLILGIDIGTTSVKVVVINPENNEIIAKMSKDTQANVPSELGREGNKQDVPKIISALNACVAKLKKNLLREVTKIGICGQMHGLMLWNHSEETKAWESVKKEDGSLIRYDVPHDKVSALYTWQDSRCDSTFLSSLPPSNSHLPTYSGFGCATLFWMSKNKYNKKNFNIHIHKKKYLLICRRPEKLLKYNCAGTIQDFAVAILCDLSKPVMSVQNAASWGYFDCTNNKWNTEILEEGGFPVQFLPEVKESGSIAGYLIEDWHTIPKGTPIGVALGDLQCSVLATLEEAGDAVLNISTSAQLAFVAENYQPTNNKPNGFIEHFPYFDNKYIAVAASLNGGNALATFVQMLQHWTMELGFSVPQSKVWEKVIALAQQCPEHSMLIDPILLGERNCPDKNASASNIHIGNLGLGQVFKDLCHGLVRNLYQMMPREYLLEFDIKRIVGNGSGLSRNKILQEEVEEFYQLPLVFTTGGDAAKGAALSINFNK